MSESHQTFLRLSWDFWETCYCIFIVLRLILLSAPCIFTKVLHLWLVGGGLGIYFVVFLDDNWVPEAGHQDNKSWAKILVICKSCLCCFKSFSFCSFFLTRPFLSSLFGKVSVALLFSLSCITDQLGLRQPTTINSYLLECTNLKNSVELLMLVLFCHWHLLC